MRTKLGLLTSNKTAFLHAANAEDSEINTHLDRYSEQDLFEFLLMVDYLLLKQRRQEHPSYIWQMRIERLDGFLRNRLPDGRLSRWMRKFGFQTAFDAHRHAEKLLFPRFR